MTCAAAIGVETSPARRRREETAKVRKESLIILLCLRYEQKNCALCQAEGGHIADSDWVASVLKTREH